MFGINKNGTKHKIGIIMPAFFPSSRVTYDGGTVEDALNGRVLAQVTADGVKTYATLLRELYSALNTQVSFEHMTLVFNSPDTNLVFVPSSVYPTYMIFARTFTGAAYTANDTVNFSASTATYYRARMQSGSTTFEDRSPTVPASGSTWTIYQ